MSRVVTNEELVNKQVALERQMIDNGEQRYTKRSNAQSSTAVVLRDVCLTFIKTW